MAETAMFAVLAVIAGFGILALIPYHRARSAATSAAYGCAQFLAEAPMDPHSAAKAAYRIANHTLNGDWSATFGVNFKVVVQEPAGPGTKGNCTVSWSVPTLFNGLLGLDQRGWNTVSFESRSEMWKAGWK